LKLDCAGQTDGRTVNCINRTQNINIFTLLLHKTTHGKDKRINIGYKTPVVSRASEIVLSCSISNYDDSYIPE